MNVARDDQAGRSAPAHRLALEWIALALALLVGVQSGRLIYALVTPQGPLGRPVASGNAAGDGAIAARFDPFFRQSGETGAGVVTGLPLKLFGTRIDFATGRGAAIIATPDGVQSSFLVGESVMPGARLASVSGDHVEIERNGARERLYLDQSVPAPAAAPATASPPVTPPPPDAATAETSVAGNSQ